MCVLGSVKGIKVNSKVGKGEEKKSGVSGSSANIYIYIVMFNGTVGSANLLFSILYCNWKFNYW